MDKIEKINKAIGLVTRKIVAIQDSIDGFGGQNFPDLSKKWKSEIFFLNTQLRRLNYMRTIARQDYVRKEIQLRHDNDWIYGMLAKSL